MSSRLIPLLDHSRDVLCRSLEIYSALCLDTWNAQGSKAVFTNYLLVYALMGSGFPALDRTASPRGLTGLLPLANILSSFVDIHSTLHIIHCLKYTMQWLQYIQGVI